ESMSGSNILRIFRLGSRLSMKRQQPLKVLCPICPETELSLDTINSHIVSKHNNIKPKKKKKACKQLYYRACILAFQKVNTETTNIKP
ncbi:hypothetical protein, partial [Kistimonas scapharcae]|uniref:hypothetical protein n=1 Tax=Kistimonas scapharcae TaxID=1036133 RepID=UPI0031E71300